jgi:proteasome lid subunit RPN8/RPN11
VNGAVRIQRNLLHQMVEHARQEPRLECCGLLAGRDAEITHAFPAQNVAADPARNYVIAPKEVVGLMRDFRARGLEFLGIYHSHPNGENVPSRRDIELAYYSEAVYFIVSPLGLPKRVRAFSICDGRVAELEIQMLP